MKSSRSGKIRQREGRTHTTSRIGVALLIAALLVPEIFNGPSALANSTATPAPSATPILTPGSTPSPTPSTAGTPGTLGTSGTSATPGTTSAPGTGQQPRKILTGWIPYYSMKTALPSAILNADLIQQVSPFWYSLKDQNTIADYYTPANPSTPISVPIASMQAAGFKIIPTITDGTDVNPKTGKVSQMVLSNLLADPKSRANIVNAIVNLVNNNKFDGIDLDFENFAYVDPISSWSTTQPRWVQFLTDLSTALHSSGKILSITTPPLFDPATGKKGYYVYAWSQVANIVDQVHIMAYDYSTTTPGPIGPLPWTTSAVTYAVSVIPASKIYIGVPGYGRDWVTKVIGTCPTLPINYNQAVAVGKVATVVMHDAANLAAAYGATPIYNQTLAEASFTYQKVYNGTTASGSLTTCTAYRTVWYQNPQSYTARANLVAQYHLAGLSEWTFGMEDPMAFQSVRNVALSISPDSIAASITSDVTTASVGSTVTATGTFLMSDNTPAAGIPVHLQTQIAGGPWTTVQDGVTDANGTFNAKVVVTQNTNLRMFSDGNWQRLEGDTPTIAISVPRVITWSVPASMKAGIPYTIHAQVSLAAPGVTVNLVSNSSTQIPGTTDATGAVTFSVTNDSPGFITYSLNIPGDLSYAATQTGLVTVWIR